MHFSRLSRNRLDLLGFLDDGAAAAEAVQTEIFAAAALDATLLADFASDLGLADDVGDWDEREAGMHTA